MNDRENKGSYFLAALVTLELILLAEPRGLTLTLLSLLCLLLRPLQHPLVVLVHKLCQMLHANCNGNKKKTNVY